MPRFTRSRDDTTATSSIAEETSPVNGESNWLDSDLIFLSQSPLDVQLRAILGQNTAESFLHPTIKDKKKVKTDAKIILSRNQGTIDAHELWHSLRANSQIKLSREGNELLSQSWPREGRYIGESRILKQIQYSRHRTDLMNRVSQINKVKTKEMLKDFFLTSFDEDFSDIGNSEAKRVPPTVLQPLKEEENFYESKEGTAFVTDSGSRIKFVSEEDCRCSGSFRERLEDIGVSCNIGISMADRGFKNSNSSHSLRRNHRHEAKHGNIDGPSADRNPSQRDDVIRKSRNELWEPLTMEALIQQGEPTIGVVNAT